MWCSTVPSVIRVFGNLQANYSMPGKKRQFAERQFIPVFVGFPCISCQKTKIRGRTGQKKSRLSITRPTYSVYHKRMGLSTGRCGKTTDLLGINKWKIVILYNIPGCVFEKKWYDKHTKRWYQWSLKTRFLKQLEADRWFLPFISSVYIWILTKSKIITRKWFNFCQVDGTSDPKKAR